METKFEEEGGSTFTKGDKDEHHRTIVPPKARELVKGKSLSYKSSEFKKWPYFLFRDFRTKSISQVYICGSDRQIRPILLSIMYFSSLSMFLR